MSPSNGRRNVEGGSMLCAHAIEHGPNSISNLLHELRFIFTVSALGTATDGMALMPLTFRV